MKPSNKFLEQQNITPTRAKLHRKWKNIAQELSDYNLSPQDLFDLGVSDNKLVNAIAEKNNLTIGDIIMLQQAKKAIEQQDTKAAEFFRDTMGENPKQVVEVQKSALQQMTEEEILNALESIKQYQGGNDEPDIYGEPDPDTHTDTH